MRLLHSIKNIPHELKQWRHWVLWKLEQQKGKKTKVLYRLDDRRASVDDPGSWSSFEEACVVYQAAGGAYAGLGFVFSADDPFCGVDLDSDEGKLGFACMHDGGLLGILTDEGQAIIQTLNSYAEYSQSGTGVHIIVKAQKPGKRSRSGNFEVYDQGRFFAMTGNRLAEAPTTIEPRQAELNTVYDTFFPPKATKKEASERPAPKSPPLNDSDVLSIARNAANGEKFQTLYAGEWQAAGYGSQSEADQALCNMLAFNTQDPEQLDRLFRGSGLMRDKWEREDYSGETIRKAISDLSAWYGVGDAGEGSIEGLVKKSPAQLITEMTADMDFFHTQDSEAYVRLQVKGHKENWRVRSTGFKTLLTKMFYDRHKKVVGSQTLADALNVLEGKALHDGPERKVYLRAAEVSGTIYVDLCNEIWQAVKITAAGWEMIDEPPVIFKRTKTMTALPMPLPDGQIEWLRPFLNVKNDGDFLLTVAWILATYRDRYPFPIMTIQGEQGSAKSTTTKVIRSLVDPSMQPLQTFPENERDLAIKANGTWVLAVDNLSGLSAKMSDILCKLSTGGGFSTRKLHTDDEEMVFNSMRPIILNGIDDIAKRPDLLDRALVLNLPAIDQSQRKEEREFWQEFEALQPYILGALFDAVAGALRNLEQIKLKEMPRMLDFAKWSAAAWQGEHWDILYGDFMLLYQGNRQLAVEQGIDSDPFATAIIRLMEKRDKWEGSPSEALSALSAYANQQDVFSKAWPSHYKLRDRVRRLAPALRAKGIEFLELPKTNKSSMVSFTRYA